MNRHALARSKPSLFLGALTAAALLAGCGGGGGGGGEKTLTAVAITPTPIAIAPGGTLQLKATGTYSDASTEDLTATSTWSSSSTTVATVSTSGLLTGVAAGATTVTARSSGVSGTQAATVSGPAVVSLTVTPTSSDITRNGAAVPLTAMATFSDSPTPVDVSSRATWTTSPAGQLVISSSGSATAPPQAIVGVTGTATASLGGKGASAALRVVRGPAYGPRTSTSNDPLTSEQWYLENTGPNQWAYADKGGTLGEDLRLSDAWELGLKGEGVKVAILDDGVQVDHEDLKLAKNDGSWNWITEAKNIDPSNPLDPTDPSPSHAVDNHGTQVTGIIAMLYGNSVGGMGIAPGVKLNAYNVIAEGLQQTEDKWQAALGEVQPNKAGPKSDDVWVFNQSYGGASPTPVLMSATIEDTYRNGVEKLRERRGALYVKAAGNGFIGDNRDNFFTVDACTEINKVNPGTCSPNCEGANAIRVTCANANMDERNSTPYNIVVGALAATERKASYSTAGSALWVSAPGGEGGANDSVDTGWPAEQYEPAMVTTDRMTCTAGASITNAPVPTSKFNRGIAPTPNTSCNYSNTMNGTSSAAPAVSGAIALLLDARPDLTWREVKHILAVTARKVDPNRAAVTVTDMADGEYEVEPAWTENKANRWFHNWYGFGAVDVKKALAAAGTFRGGSLNAFVKGAWIPSKDGLALDIPDNSSKGASDFLEVTAPLVVEVIEAVQIRVNITHPKPGDLGLELLSPSGTKSILLNIRNGFVPGAGLDMIFESNLFYGELAAGRWTLKVVDGAATGRGTLNSWQLRIFGHKQ